MYLAEGALAPEAKYIAVIENIDGNDIVIISRNLCRLKSGRQYVH